MSENSGISMLNFQGFIGNGVVYNSSTNMVTIYFSAENQKWDVTLTKDQAQSLLTKLQDAIK